MILSFQRRQKVGKKEALQKAEPLFLFVLFGLGAGIARGEVFGIDLDADIAGLVRANDGDGAVGKNINDVIALDKADLDYVFSREGR